MKTKKIKKRIFLVKFKLSNLNLLSSCAIGCEEKTRNTYNENKGRHGSQIFDIDERNGSW